MWSNANYQKPQNKQKQSNPQVWRHGLFLIFRYNHFDFHFHSNRDVSDDDPSLTQNLKPSSTIVTALEQNVRSLICTLVIQCTCLHSCTERTGKKLTKRLDCRMKMSWWWRVEMAARWGRRWLVVLRILDQSMALLQITNRKSCDAGEKWQPTNREGFGCVQSVYCVPCIFHYLFFLSLRWP